MNAKLLRDAISRFGDDPVGIVHFRKVIIGLAIGGKLTGEGDPLSLEQMRARIEEEKCRLLRGGQNSRLKHYGPVSEEQLPEVFSDPSSFVPLGSIARIEKGLTGIQGAKSGSFPLVVTAAERGSSDHFDFEGAATIVPLVSSTGHGHASINRLHYQEGRFALGTILAAILPLAPDLISARFIYEYLSTFKEELLVSRMTGTANVTLSVGRIAEVPIPLISPTIQRKADELMAVCDQLEAARAEREAARDTFTLSALAKLNTPDPETFGQDASFALAKLAPLTTRPDQIKQLRQTILDLAVRGRLVKSDLKDEPAAAILARAKSAKQILMAERCIRRDSDPELSSSGGKSIWPDHWAATRLYDFALVMGGKRLPAGASFSPAPTNHVYIRVTDMKGGTIATSGLKYISHDVRQQIRRYIINSADLYVTIAGTIGEAGKVPNELDGQNLTENAAKIVFREIDKSFLLMVLRSTDVQAQFQEKTKQMAQPKLALKRIAGAEIPIPPLAEQHRMVAKVDELMALCDKLEASITTGEQTRSRLLEAVLHNALEPA